MLNAQTLPSKVNRQYLQVLSSLGVSRHQRVRCTHIQVRGNDVEGRVLMSFFNTAEIITARQHNFIFLIRQKKSSWFSNSGLG